jgi:hypothetical protein
LDFGIADFEILRCVKHGTKTNQKSKNQTSAIIPMSDAGFEDA